MGNIACQNYYCQDISLKPEWFSENCWKINYEIENESESISKLPLPYSIEKGILIIKDCNIFKLLLTKKLLIDFSIPQNISIPLNFTYNCKSKINIYILFSIDDICIKDILFDLNLNEKLFYINIELENNRMILKHSFSEDIFKKKIISKNINNICLNIENNINLIRINEKMSSCDIDETYVTPNIFDNVSSIYLSIYICSNQIFKKKEFLKMNFD